MPKTIFLMRHGQTRFNQLGKVQGSCDSPLTALGIEQAQAAAQYFKQQAIDFDQVFASTQERACDTAEYVSGRNDYIRLKGLKEWDFGLFEGEQQHLQPKHPDQPTYGDFFVAFGGESDQQVMDRMNATMRHIVTDYESNCFLAVSHGGASWCFFLQLALDEYPELRFSNCCIFEYAYTDGAFSLERVIDPVANEVLTKGGNS